MDTLGEIGSSISSGVGAVGNELGALPGQIGNFFGGGGANPGAGAVNGTPGAVAPAVASPAGTGASGAPLGGGAEAGANGGLPTDLSQSLDLNHTGGALDAGIQAAGAPTLNAAIGAGGADPAGLGSTPNLTPATSDDIISGRTPGLHLPAPLVNTALPAGPTIAPPKANGVESLLSSLMSPKSLPGLVNAGLLLKDVVSPGPGASQLKQLKAQASEEQGQATNLAASTAAEQLGQLPQPAQSVIDRALQERIAQIKNQYAQAGMSGSSAENADIAAAKTDAVNQQFQLGQSLAQSGIQQMQFDDQSVTNLLQNIISTESAQGTELGNLIERMAGFIGGTPEPVQTGGGHTITIN